MRTIWHSLVWKEWHEHKWKLAAMTAIFVGVAASVLVAVNRDPELDPMALLAALLYAVVPQSLFMAALAAAGERSKSTLGFYQSLPVPMWKAGLSKLLYGLATCLIPIALTIAAWNIWSLVLRFLGRNMRHLTVEKFPPQWLGIHPLLNWNLFVVVIVSVVAASLFLWTATVGVNRRSEVIAGGLGLLTIVISWTAIIVGARWVLPDHSPLPLWPFGIILAAAPGGLALFLAAKPLASNGWELYAAVATATLVHFAVATVYVLRFGRTTLGFCWSPAADRQRLGPIFLRPPRRSKLSAIIWKQFREFTPLIVAGMVGIAALVGVNVLRDPKSYGQPRQLIQLLVSIASSVGLLIALIAGIAIFDHDLGPRLNTFWRSRPINPSLWFWAKFVSGLLIILSAFCVPIVAFWWLSRDSVSQFDNSQLLVFGLHVAVFAAAVAAICLIRQTIYAAILGVGFVALVVMIPWIWMDPLYMRVGSVIVTVSALTTVATTLVAWLAVRYDWGRKS
jgi:hypothetical protein